MEPAVLIAAFALGVSIITFAYRLGRDTKSSPPRKDGEDKLDQIYTMLETANQKIDKIVDWQREATGIHEKHGEQIKTLFEQIKHLENRMEDRQIINAALQKILERIG